MKIAILGMGKIGSGVYEYAAENENLFVKRTLDIVSRMENMTTDINDIVSDPEIEAVVETMGGLEPARTYALKCLNAGKHYVTANKHLVSECMEELQAAADQNGCAFLFSAACGGGIQILRSLYNQRNADKIVSFRGILNGTTNYMLDRIESENLTYGDALSQAQALGYAEADPTSDVDGLDALRKLVLAMAVGFGVRAAPEMIPTSGIRGIEPTDIAYFKEKKLTPKLIAEATQAEDGISASVELHLFPITASEASIRRNVNYACFTGEKSGAFAFSGQGAGKYPTAANIIQDLNLIMAGQKRMLPEVLKPLDKLSGAAHSYYVRVPEAAMNEARPFCKSGAQKNGWFIAETVLLTETEKQELAGAITDSFFARIEQEAK